MSKKDVFKVVLDESDIPKQWYNILADMPNKPAPYISSQTGKIASADELQAIFPLELIQQENSQERWIDIPEEVREMYRQWRPSPLYRAKGLEKYLGTPARIITNMKGQMLPEATSLIHHCLRLTTTRLPE